MFKNLLVSYQRVICGLLIVLVGLTNCGRDEGPSAEPQLPAPATVTAAPTVAPTAVPPEPSPATEEPTPTAEPSPTPDPVMVAPAIAYIEEGDVYLINLRQDGSIWMRDGAPELLLQGTSATQVKFSPDGQRLLLASRMPENGQIDVIQRDGEEFWPVVEISELPLLAPAYGDVLRLLDKIVWFPDSQRIAFNTAITVREGPGLGPLADLWFAPLEGELQQRLEPGQGGGRFAIAPTMETVILTAPMEVLTAAVEGNDRAVLLTHEFVTTYSEYIYFADVHWTADGQTAYLAIPSPDPVFGEAYAEVWTITDGVATKQQRLIGNILFHPPRWTADGGRLAYVQQIVAESNPPEQLIIALGDGSEQRPYGEPAESLGFFGWNPAGTHFVYGNKQTHFLGALGQEPHILTLPSEAQIQGVKWLSETQFVVQVVEQGITTLYSGHIDGQLVALLTVPTTTLVLDVWAP